MDVDGLDWMDLSEWNGMFRDVSRSFMKGTDDFVKEFAKVYF